MAERTGDLTPDGGRGGVAVAAFLLGFALSGFFDGVLLHQILQWHHLLGALDGDLRFQVVADGWFHAGMYAIAALGLWRLWRARGELRGAGAAEFAGWGLIGFGSWHLVDAVGSHWLLGIHRIRMDAASPLAWDLGWLAVFGLVPLAIGLRLRSRGGGGGGDRSAAALVLAVAAIGGWAALPPAERSFATVAFAPGVPPARAFEAAALAGDGVIWSDAAGGVYVVAGVGPLDALRLLRRGALFVGGAGLPDGCLAWSEDGPAVGA